MKVYNRVVIDIASGNVLEEDSYDYTGPVSECKGGGSQNTVEKSDPWEGVQQYLKGGSNPQYRQEQQKVWVPGKIGTGMGKDRNEMSQGHYETQYKQVPIPGTEKEVSGLFPEAERLYREHNPTYFPGSTVTPFSNETEMALGSQARRAMMGSDVTRAAQNENLATARGDYLHGGHGFDAAFQAASNRIIPQVDSQFASAGRYGGGLADVAKTQALSDSFANLYGQERGRQQQAVSMAPMLANQDYYDINQLATVGQQREDLSAEYLADQVARHDFQQNLPYQKLQQYAGLIQPGAGMGGTRMSSSPIYRNRTSGALGGAMAGYSMGGPWGAAAGGLLGYMGS